MDSFPKNRQQFEALLEQLECSEPNDFLSEGYSDTAFVSFIFLWTIWEEIEDPDDSSYTTEKIDLLKERIRQNPRLADPKIEIAEKMLNAGITPREISSLISLEQERYAKFICYHIEEPTSHVPWELGKHLQTGLCMIKWLFYRKPLWGLSDLFHSARPKSRSEN